MQSSEMNDQLIKQTLSSAKTIAMIGVSSPKKEDKNNLIRRPSTIVMSYLQEFGYKVIPVNPFSTGKKINGETFVEKLEDIKESIDIINVFIWYHNLKISLDHYITNKFFVFIRLFLKH